MKLKRVMFALLTMGLSYATDPSDAVAQSATNETPVPTAEGVVARIESAMKLGEQWIVDHFHTMVQEFETVFGVETQENGDVAVPVAPVDEKAPATGLGSEPAPATDGDAPQSETPAT